MATLQPKSNPIASVPVCLSGTQLTVMEAYHLLFLRNIVQVVGFPQVLAFPLMGICIPKCRNSSWPFTPILL